MPRPARFTHDDILDAALAGVVNEGPRVSVADIAHQLQGPVGSIYHRFSSRDALMVRLWMRSVERFQAGLAPLALIPDPHEALIAMARHIPQFCRAHQDEATSLTLFRQDRLLDECPDELLDVVATMNDTVIALLADVTRRRYSRVTERHLHCVRMATVVAPYGLVRPYLGGPIPPLVDDATVAAADAILRLGDHPYRSE
ncbi:MAG: TetR/AcrR family transcriptional regulator [Humibacillus sp.]|nr:TetR/AcrR family transcriptional regulator [Humibacillus sp.]MDN5775462.1 TetR/AcrR family transcriptional regulator [Humibacillus sp.]